jgi:NAD(P)H dehydrogenase (quinone)
MRPQPRHALILCHPSANSFTAAIAKRYRETVAAAGHDVIVRDLYRLQFDPVLKFTELDGSRPPDVALELATLAECDVFVFVYPIWFGAPPAMLVGYVDRVFGAAYPFAAIKERRTHPLLTGKQLVSLTVSGSMRTWLEEKGVIMSVRNLFERYLADIFAMRGTEHFHFDGVIDPLADLDARIHLHDVGEAAKRVMGRLVRDGREKREPAAA